MTLSPDSVWVEADITRLAQMIGNLLNNAAKYTDEGGSIWLTVEKANMRFRSVCTMAYITPTAMVMVPTHTKVPPQAAGQVPKLCMRAAR